MSKQIYTSPTGLYSIRLGVDLIHEGLTPAEAADLIAGYLNRASDEDVEWAFEPDKLRVERFSGKYLLKGK